MTLFDELLLLAAKIGLTIFAIVFIARWGIVIYLQRKYDGKISAFYGEIEGIRNEERGRAAVQPVIDGAIAARTGKVREKIERLEVDRRLFLDKVNLFLSLMGLQQK